MRTPDTRMGASDVHIPEPGKPVGMPKRVLVAEDHEDSAKIFTIILSHMGYEAVTVGDGQSALDVVRSAPLDLVLLDVSMPILDGWEVCRQIRADPKVSHMPIVMLTAHALASDRNQAFACGATEFIAKPVEPRKVMAVVKDLIGEP